MSQAAGTDAGTPHQKEQSRSTRERILDVALELFVEKGFDKTSLREIAERLGFTKAALYYHFASKEDILMALHLRMHDLVRDLVDQLKEHPGPEQWSALIYEALDRAIANRQIFLLHERNRAAFEELHDKGHDSDHEDMETVFRQVFGDPAIPAATRIRMICSFGAAMTGVVMGASMLGNVDSDTLRQYVKESVADLLVPMDGRRRARGA
jgi:AcrR family transcriptional regulator